MKPKKPQDPQNPSPFNPGGQGIPVPPQIQNVLNQLVKSFENFMSSKSECGFCVAEKTKALKAFNTAMRDGSANFTASFKPTGAKHAGNQEGIKICFGTTDPVLMLVMTSLATVHMHREIMAYWRKQGRSEEEREHVTKAMAELAGHLESEYVKRLESIQALENGTEEGE